MNITKAIEISDAKIKFVSLVDKAANLRQFLITKAEKGSAQFTTYGKILKVDDATHYITGVVYEPMVADSDDNYMTEEEITKAAHWFMKNDGKNDIQHSFEPAEGVRVVESYVAPCDMEIGGEAVVKGTWLMTVEVTNTEVWDAVLKGEITGFSMGGVGKYSEEDTNLEVNKGAPAIPPLAKGSVVKQAEGLHLHITNAPEIVMPDTPEKLSGIQKIAKWLGFDVVEKGAMMDAYKERTRCDAFWNAFWSLEDILYRYNWSTDRYEFNSDEATVREALSEFNEIITEILTGQNISKALATAAPINKAGKKISSANKQKLDEAYQLLTDLRTEFEEAESDGEIEKEDSSMNLTQEQVQQMIETAVAKALAGNPETTPATSAADTPATEPLTGEGVQKMIDESVKKALAAQTMPTATAADAAGTVEPTAEALTPEAVQKMIDKAIDPALKARGLPSNLNDQQQQQVEKSSDAFDGFFI